MSNHPEAGESIQSRSQHENRTSRLIKESRVLLLRLRGRNPINDFERVPIDAILPGPIRRRLHIPKSLPHGTVALEPAPERNLPHPIPLPHPPLCLNVGKFIPNRTGRGVAKSVEGHPRGLNVHGQQLQVLLELINHGPPTGMDTEVLESQLEVGNVGLDLGVEQLLGDKGGKEEELLADRKDKGAEGGDVGASRDTAGNGPSKIFDS
ncbi:uncharacterized protein A4U43_C01F36220 [Asparagus officinalis]|uniref:Uncharacterized protein n=1 Tax=Asparagus officinalis TaxID=4686 RepID=A0A5P1FXU9_ASPOF|nr:uncharacterized protein A4U43_C01F36220 [Asparagus officinalis]